MGEKVLDSDEVREKILKGNLDLKEITVEGDLDLEGVTVEGDLDLSTKKGPSKIYIDKKMAQLVHWAAPTIPLVVASK